MLQYPSVYRFTYGTMKNLSGRSIKKIKAVSTEAAIEDRSSPFCRKSFGIIEKCCKDDNNIISGDATRAVEALSSVTAADTLAKTSLLRSYLSGSNPTREEYISKNRNVSNSLISSDSVHHSIFLESSRERRQCLLQYLSNVAADGQVVIYVNSIPVAEALMSFLKKHGFQVNAVVSLLWNFKKSINFCY